MENIGKKFLTTLLLMMAAVILMTGCSEAMNSVSLKTMTINVGKTSLNIDAPFELHDHNVNGIQTVEPYLKKYIVKQNENDDLMISVCYAVYDKEAIEAQTGQPFTPNIEGAVLRAVGNIKTLRSSSEVKEVVINGITGKEIEGTLDMKFDDNTGDSRYEFRTRAFGRGMEVWLVTVVYKPGDVNKRVSDAIFNSLKLS